AARAHQLVSNPAEINRLLMRISEDAQRLQDMGDFIKVGKPYRFRTHLITLAGDAERAGQLMEGKVSKLKEALRVLKTAGGEFVDEELEEEGEGGEGGEGEAGEAGETSTHLLPEVQEEAVGMEGQQHGMGPDAGMGGHGMGGHGMDASMGGGMGGMGAGMHDPQMQMAHDAQQMEVEEMNMQSAEEAAMSGVTASKEDEEASAQDMEDTMENTTWSIDVLPQPMPSDVEPQDPAPAGVPPLPVPETSSGCQCDPMAKCGLQGQPFTWCRVGTAEESPAARSWIWRRTPRAGTTPWGWGGGSGTTVFRHLQRKKGKKVTAKPMGTRVRMATRDAYGHDPYGQGAYGQDPYGHDHGAHDAHGGADEDAEKDRRRLNRRGLGDLCLAKKTPWHSILEPEEELPLGTRGETAMTTLGQCSPVDKDGHEKDSRERTTHLGCECAARPDVLERYLDDPLFHNLETGEIDMAKVPFKDRITVEAMQKYLEPPARKCPENSRFGGEKWGGDGGDLCQKTASSGEFLVCPAARDCAGSSVAGPGGAMPSGWFSGVSGKSWDFCAAPAKPPEPAEPETAEGAYPQDAGGGAYDQSGYSNMQYQMMPVHLSLLWTLHRPQKVSVGHFL
ncbi:unnamed protein product, partial [Effrenium voratum]